VVTQTTVKDVEQEDRQLLAELWELLLATGNGTAKQLVKADRAMGKYTDRQGKITAKAKTDYAGYGLAWMTGIAATIGGLNDDMSADEPIRLLEIIGELILANAERCPEFGRVYTAWSNLEAYCTGQWERDDFDYPLAKSEALAVLHDHHSKVKEAAA